MFKGLQEMSLAGNAAAAAPVAAAASAAAAAASLLLLPLLLIRIKCVSTSLIFRATKCCFSLASMGYATRTPHQEKINYHREVPRTDRFMKIDINHPQYT